jgi:alanine racemase
MRATRAIIHLENLTANIMTIRRYLGGNSKPQICMPVKADAYGHGAVRIAKTALSCGVTMLAVATADEGVELREAGILVPILVLCPLLPDEFEAAAVYRLTPLISDKEAVTDFTHALAKLPEFHHRTVFLKIDTGMRRCGCAPYESIELARFILEHQLIIGGTITHFAVSDSSYPHDIAWTEQQLSSFIDTLHALRKAGINPGIISAANSGAVSAHPRTWFDMVRPGIMLYGYQELIAPDSPHYIPVMELTTQIMLIKRLNKHESVSYGRTWIAPEDTYIGVLPLGYADGLPRLLSTEQELQHSPFFVVINGETYPLAGRICMDQCMVNLGPVLKVQRYDIVTIFGHQSPALNAAELAQKAHTIPYEITCGISKRVPRIYVS